MNAQERFSDFLKKIVEKPINRWNDILSLVTLSGLLPLKMGMSSLSTLTECLIDQLPLIESLDISKTQIESEKAFQLYFQKTGRFIAYNESITCMPDIKEDFFIGSLVLDDSNYELIKNSFENLMIEEDYYYALIEDEFTVISKNLNEYIDKIEDFITRFETLFIYCEESLFISANLTDTTLELWNNLVPDEFGKSILRDMKSHPLTRSQRIFIVIVSCLMEIGNPLKFEELNGLNLNSRNFYQWLVKKVILYSKAVKKTQGNLELNSLSRLVKQIKEYNTEIEKHGYIRYRRVNGINFNKSEYLLKKTDIENSINIIPETFLSIGKELGIEPLNHYKNYLDTLVDKIITVNCKNRNPLTITDNNDIAVNVNFLEYLVYKIVEEASGSSGMEYCFSSGFKDIGKLINKKSDDFEYKLEPGEFFCCFNDLKNKGNSDVCGGMQGNRWNYFGGNLDHQKCRNVGRYFRYPLLLPDICYNTHLHHDGHARLHIRCSLRVSGPLLDTRPIELSGTGFRSFYDLRGAKFRGNFFSLSDLTNLMKLCVYLDHIWKKIAEEILENNLEAKINIYDGNFYDSVS